MRSGIDAGSAMAHSGVDACVRAGEVYSDEKAGREIKIRAGCGGAARAIASLAFGGSERVTVIMQAGGIDR